MTDTTIQTATIAANVRLDVKAAGPGPLVSMVAYTGGPMRIPGFKQPVVVEISGVGLPADVPLLRDHRNSTGDLLGTVEAQAASGKIIASGSLTDSNAAAEIIRMHRASQKFQASVGVDIIERETVAPGESVAINGQTIQAGKGGLLIVRKGELREISIVPAGADSKTEVEIQAGHAAAKTEQGAKTMTTDQKQEIAAALERINSHEDVVNKDTLKRLRASYLGGEIDANQLADELSQAALNAARHERELAKRPSANMNFYRGGDGGAMNQDSLTASFLIANGQEEVALAAYGDETCQRARDAGLRSHDDHVRAAMRLAHADIPADPNERVNAAASTVTYGEMLTRGAQAVLLAGARNYPDGYKRISRKMSVPDFRTHQAVRAYLANGTFAELPDTGEIEHASPGGEGYPIKASTFARMIEFGRQTVTNDQTGMLLEHVHELGRDYARTEADLFWSVILDEGGTFFKAANGNYDADSELGVDGLETAIQKLRAMTTEDGRPIDVTPGFLAVPPSLETTARQLLNSSELRYGLAEGDSRPAGNPFRDSMGLVVSPRLSASNGGSDAAWYVVSTPQSIPAFLRCYVGGRDVATVEQTDADFNTLGVRVRAWFDFGAALGDPRGAIKLNATS